MTIKWREVVESGESNLRRSERQFVREGIRVGDKYAVLWTV